MLKIVAVPHKVLASPTKPVGRIDDSVKKLVKEMEETLEAQSDPQGVGLAANQVGLSLSLFIIKRNPEAKIQAFINPRVLKAVGKKPASKSAGKRRKRRRSVKLEGCLSIPRIWGPVKRTDKIYLEYKNLAGETKKEWFSGFVATIIQHEIDHLEGIVFTQRSLEQKAPLYKEVNGKLKPFEV